VLYTNNANHDFSNDPSVTGTETFLGHSNKDNAELERRAMMENLQQHRIQVTIPARTDLSVGTVIVLNIPSPESQANNDDTSDQINDDRYLIIDLCLEVNPIQQRGVLKLECVKESYAKRVADSTPASMVKESQT